MSAHSGNHCEVSLLGMLGWPAQHGRHVAHAVKLHRNATTAVAFQCTTVVALEGQLNDSCEN